MIQITATELKSNLGKYITLASLEKILITKNGVHVAVLSAPNTTPSWVDSLAGIASDFEDDAKLFKTERLALKNEIAN